MATAEGDFPKTGNDPLYASEVNSFVSMIDTGSIYPAIGSSTDFQVIGSKLIDDSFTIGSEVNKFSFNGITNNMFSAAAAANTFQVRLRVSGNSFNIVSPPFIGSGDVQFDDGGDNRISYNVDGFMGNKLIGLESNGVGIPGSTIGNINTERVVTWESGTINTKPFVIFYEGLTNLVGATIAYDEFSLELTRSEKFQ